MSKLISGKEAFNAAMDGKTVLWRHINQNNWLEWSRHTAWCIDALEHDEYQFKLKPKTITLNGIEVHASSNVYNGGLIWILCGTDTREYTSLALDERDELPAYFWDSEDKIKQVVAALRSIFKGE